MSNLQTPQQQEHCFARLKARPLMLEEIESVSGGIGTTSFTGISEIKVKEDGSVDIGYDDQHGDNSV